MSYYADSSFLVSCYLPDANTSKAKSYLSSVGAPLVLNALQALEVGNAFELGVFRGLFSATDAASARANLAQDLRSGRLVTTAVNWPVTFRVASALSKRHSATTGTRSLDILHVAAAKSLRAVEFITFDSRQRLLATALGLKFAP
jgi:predicted nucleic acid-binding protein